MNRFRFFNLVCFGLSCFFILASAYLWRSAFGNVGRDENIEAVQVVVNENKIESEIEERIAEEEFVEEVAEVVEEEELVVSPGVLPGKINLDVPFTSQAPEKNWEQPWQDACEEAAVLMIDAYYKGYGLSPLSAKDEILRMVEWEDNLGWAYSINIERVGKLTKWQMGSDFNFKIVENPTIEQIKKFVANKTPVLVVAYGKDLPNPHFTNGGPEYHALIIRGYTEEKFITNDPGTQFGENFSYYYDDLMNAIRDWNGGDVENGRRVVLVIE